MLEASIAAFAVCGLTLTCVLVIFAIFKTDP